MVVVKRASEYSKRFASRLALQHSEATNTTHIAMQQLGTVTRFFKEKRSFKAQRKLQSLGRSFESFFRKLIFCAISSIKVNPSGLNRSATCSRLISWNSYNWGYNIKRHEIGRVYSMNEVGKEINSKFSRKVLMYATIRKMYTVIGGYYLNKRKINGISRCELNSSD
jgi:hypothetical protein